MTEALIFGVVGFVVSFGINTAVIFWTRRGRQ